MKDTHTIGQILPSLPELSLLGRLKFSARDWLVLKIKQILQNSEQDDSELTKQKLTLDFVMPKAFMLT